MASTSHESNATPNEHLARTQLEVNELKEIIVENVERVIARGQNLSDLQESCENLEMQAGKFSATCRRVKRKMYFRNKKFTLVISLVCLAILLVLIASALIYYFAIK